MFVVLATCAVICGLAFFIVNVMGWPIGPIEVIALIVFIGYAVTYSLHIAHLYGSDESAEEAENTSNIIPKTLRKKAALLEADTTRMKRTRFALESVGGAALGSAITTAG